MSPVDSESNQAILTLGLLGVGVYFSLLILRGISGLLLFHRVWPTALITWLPTYFHRVDNLPMDKAGMKTSVIFLLAIIGAPLGGFITDK